MDAPAASTVSRSGAPADLIFRDLRALLRLAGPVVLSRLGIMTMGLTDTVVVGRYSAVQLGFHALGWAPTAVVLTVAISLLNGVPVMTSQVIGEGRRNAAGAVLRRGLVYGGQIGLVSTLILAGGGPWFLHHAALAPGPRRRGQPRAGGLHAVADAALPGDGDQHVAGGPGQARCCHGGDVAEANLVNLAFDLVLVPGRLGFPALGAIGGACATLASRTALMAALLIYVATKREARGLGVFAKPPRERAAEAEQRHIGYLAPARPAFSRWPRSPA